MAESGSDVHQVFAVPPRLAGAHCDSIDQYDKMYEQSIEDPGTTELSRCLAIWVPWSNSSKPWRFCCASAGLCARALAFIILLLG